MPLPVATIVCPLSAIVFAASATPVAAQGRPHYRAYAMGDSLLAISRQVGLPVIDATTTPAASGTVQELRWHARYCVEGLRPRAIPSTGWSSASTSTACSGSSSTMPPIGRTA